MSRSLAPIGQEPSADRLEIEAAVRDRLNQNCSYRVYFDKISFQCDDGVLSLHGKLPSFYLKQLLQAALRNIDGVQKIDNHVDVVNASGLSSSRGG